MELLWRQPKARRKQKKNLIEEYKPHTIFWSWIQLRLVDHLIYPMQVKSVLIWRTQIESLTADSNSLIFFQDIFHKSIPWKIMNDVSNILNARLIRART